MTTRASAARRHLKLGLALYLIVAAVLVALAFKPQIKGALASGRPVTAEFSNSYKLRAHDSTVKIAGLEVGTVERLEYTDRDTVIVHMKVPEDDLATLGSEPTASIEPRVVLGGRYTIDLRPGGDPDASFDGTIPIARTSHSVELDSVLEALPATSREALQGLVGKAGPTLARSDEALRGLLRTAPGVLRPGTDVVRAARGTRPDQDLPAIVAGLESTARVLTRRPGELDAIVRDLGTTARTLGRHRQALAATLRDLPATVTAARSGLEGLDDVARRLTTAADRLGPTAPRLVDLVDQLDPALSEARPVLHDLVPLLRDARPAVQQLVPAASRGTGVMKDLHGPVLDRVNGPVARFVLNPWKGTGPFKGGAAGYLADHTFYEELAYMATNIDRASMTQDQYGSTLAFQAGVSQDTALDGLPFTLDGIVRLALDHEGVTSPALRRLALQRAGLR